MKKIIQIFKIKDLRRKILVVAALLVIFRLMAAVPIPGIDSQKLREFFSSSQLFGFLNIFSGGALSRLSIMMLGVGPYITATIILQLLIVVFPKLKEMYYEEGAAGRAKFNRYSRYLTVPLAIVQGYGFLNLLKSQGVIPNLSLFPLLINVTVITAGSVLLMWIGELINEYKIGDGVSLLIFAGIISGLPEFVRSLIFTYNPSALPSYFVFALLAIIVIAGVTFVNESERKIPVSYAKRVRGTKMYGGVDTYLPIKANQAGVMPIIFAISVLMFPQFAAQVVSIFSVNLSLRLNALVANLFNQTWIYGLLYFILVVVFTYFYTAITFDPQELSKNLQQNGGFIPGLRPGQPTAEFIAKIVNRITFFGSIFLGLIAVLPLFLRVAMEIPALTIGGTALLIVVAVALEIMKQIDSQLVIREYEGFF